MEVRVSSLSYDRVSHVAAIPTAVYRALAEDPAADLYRYVTHNVSGGHEYWGDDAQAIYRNPATPEEGLLALELRDVLLKAALSHVSRTYRKYRRRRLNSGISGFRTDLSVLLSFGRRLTIRDPIAALEIKRMAAALCLELTGIPLTRFYDSHLRHRGEDHPAYSQF